MQAIPAPFRSAEPGIRTTERKQKPMIKQIKFMVLLTLSILLLLLMTACGQARRNPVFSIDENGNLIVEYENGDMQILGNVKGEENNEDEEKSITNAELNADGELILTFSDGSTVNLGNIKQEQPDETGDTETEDIRITGAEIVDGHLVLTFSNHFHVTVGKVSGSDGRKIESITITDGIWYIKYADGSEEPVTEPVFQESGSISSTIAKNLTLRADWEAVSYDWKTAEVTVNVDLTCWSISVGAREGEYAGTVTLNGETKTFSTPAIKHTLNEQKKFRFASFTFEIELNADSPTELELEVSWPFNGTYANQKIGTLKAAGIISLPCYTAESAEDDALTTRSAADSSAIPNADAPLLQSKEEPAA